MKEYRVGIVGAGFIARVHAYGYLNIPLHYDQNEFRARITTVCAAHQSSADKFARQTGAERAVTDFREITENPDIDIVDIATPNSSHLEAILSAMKHGKHIYCDKPLVATMDEAREVEAAAKHYSGTMQMTLQNRFFPATIRAKQLIDEGKLGEILEFRGQYLHSGSSDPNAPLKWKLEAGTIADLGSHTHIEILNVSCLPKAKLAHRRAIRTRDHHIVGHCLVFLYLGFKHSLYNNFHLVHSFITFLKIYLHQLLQYKSLRV